MIFLELPKLPPSVNAAYMTIHKRTGKRSIPLRVLTPEGRAYKTETKTVLTQKFPTELKFLEKDKPYGLHIQLLLNNLLNTGWPKSAKTRYKRLDASNRIKLLEDVIADITGIDDSQFLTVTVTKTHTSESEMTRIWIWLLED